MQAKHNKSNSDIQKTERMNSSQMYAEEKERHLKWDGIKKEEIHNKTDGWNE